MPAGAILGILCLFPWLDFYPVLNPGCRAHKQFFQPMFPQTGPYEPQVNTRAASALVKKIRTRIFITHSQSVGLGLALRRLT